jgi:WbqC-like protein family
MRLAILQPSYLPWLGYFDQIDRVDVFVYYDDVQYDKNGWRNRNRVKGPGGPVWLTVPVQHTGRGLQRICDVEIDGQQNWTQKHLRSVAQFYAKAPYRDDYIPGLAELLGRPWTHLADLDIAINATIIRWLGLGARVVRASTLGIDGGRNERLISICRHFGASHYLSGNAAKAYVDLEAFAAAGIAVEWQDYEHPSYSQLHGAFVSHLSIIDLLMNAGPGTLDILRSGRPIDSNSA